MSDITEDELKLAVLKIDLLLKRRQAFWENARNVAIIGGTAAAILAAVFGTLGYKLAQQPPQTINVHLDAPLLATPKP